MTSREPPAFRSPAAWVVFGAVLALGLAGDLWSKSAVFAQVARHDSASTVVVPGVLKFTLQTNPGIVFGLVLPPALVVLASLVAMAAVVGFFAGSPRGAHAAHAALGMILAGALGNLYDRLFSYVQLPGRPAALRQVRDFIDFGDLHLGRLNYPWVFNVADVLLVVGVVVLVAAWTIRTYREEAAARARSAQPATGKARGRS